MFSYQEGNRSRFLDFADSDLTHRDCSGAGLSCYQALIKSTKHPKNVCVTCSYITSYTWPLKKKLEFAGGGLINEIFTYHYNITLWWIIRTVLCIPHMYCVESFPLGDVLVCTVSQQKMKISDKLN